MESSIKYSFIIPHHNAPDLLERCLSTIPCRFDVEVIVVDDNSELAKKPRCQRPDLTIIYVDKEHTKGAGYARNKGLQKAKGKWVIFVDCDDMLSSDVLSKLDKQDSVQSDIVFFRINAVDSDSLKPIDRCGIFNVYISNYKRKRLTSEGSLRYNHMVPWGKMIRRSLIRDYNISFDEVRYSNDIMFAGKCGFYAKSISVSEDILYTVTHRDGSLVTQVTKESIYCRHEVLIRRIKFLMKNHKFLFINAPLSYITYSKKYYDMVFVDSLYKCASDLGYNKFQLYLLQILYIFGYVVRHIF